MQAVKLCREHGLFGALIYLFNRGLDDFKAPLEELLVVIQNSLHSDVAAVGYFSCYLDNISEAVSKFANYLSSLLFCFSTLTHLHSLAFLSE